MSGPTGGKPELSDEALTDLVLKTQKLANTLLDLALGKFREGSIPLLVRYGFTHDQATKIALDTWCQVLDSKRKRLLQSEEA